MKTYVRGSILYTPVAPNVGSALKSRVALRLDSPWLRSSSRPGNPRSPELFRERTDLRREENQKQTSVRTDGSRFCFSATQEAATFSPTRKSGRDEAAGKL